MGTKPKSDETNEARAAAIGVDLETMRKLLAVNPALRGAGDSTQDVLQRVRGKASATESKAAAAPPAQDFFLATQALEQRFRGERKRLQQAKLALEAEERALIPATLAAFYDSLLAVDPNLTSPKTQYTLKKMQAFLHELGFSMDGLVAHQTAHQAKRK
ncbi:MAG: hypothetical protein IT381_13760 [Deltaproteobacteria bacterium]|nr:hypothetical protein [Deltaproteobacteria bacterium]